MVKPINFKYQTTVPVDQRNSPVELEVALDSANTNIQGQSPQDETNTETEKPQNVNKVESTV